MLDIEKWTLNNKNHESLITHQVAFIKEKNTEVAGIMKKPQMNTWKTSIVREQENGRVFYLYSCLNKYFNLLGSS